VAERPPREATPPAPSGREAVDAPAFAAALGRRLRRAGLPVTPERSARFARALSLAPPASRSRVYWTARAVFVSSREEVEAFDRVFAAVFDGRIDPADARGDPNAPAPPGAEAGERAPSPGARSAAPAPEALRGWATASAEPAGDADSDDEPEREVPVAAASDRERLAERSFASLEPDELVQLRRLMAQLALATPRRRSRRARSGPRGEHIDVRRTIRASLRTGGDPVRHARRRRRTRPRRLVLICDISGSMEPYARAYLQFLQSAAGGGAAAEAFVFATRLTRLTRALRGRNPEAAIRRAAHAAPDWSSGTRIGDALKAFNDRHGRRGMARGAVVVVLSDGWEHGDPALVAREMERLARLAHRIVWVNPRSAAAEFKPLTGGMIAALPHVDTLLSGHSLEALEAVAEAIGTDT
jgi:uncharacterized protein with von Willebrand factor type A (vWA) domain